MKFILSTCVGMALLCNADVQLNDFKRKYAAKSTLASSDKSRSAWISNKSASASDKKSAWASGKERSDRGGFHDIDVLEACIVEAGGCQLDFEVTALIDSVSALQAEKEAGNLIEAPAEVRTQTKAFMQCIRDMVPALAVDNACRVAAKAQRAKGDSKKLEGDSDEEGDHGSDGVKGGYKALTTISACADEIDFSCALNFKTAELVASVTALKAEANVAVTGSTIPDEVLKLQLKAALKCLKTLTPALPIDSACKAALPTKREHKKKEEADEDDKVDDNDEVEEVATKREHKKKRVDEEDDEEDEDDNEDDDDDKDDEVNNEDEIEEVASKTNDMPLLSRARIDFANRAARVNVGAAGNRRGY
jgi:hypothetical protein